MVTKLFSANDMPRMSFVLAKKLMVTKLDESNSWACKSFVLAKKLMVTKPQIHIIINLRFYKM